MFTSQVTNERGKSTMRIIAFAALLLLAGFRANAATSFSPDDEISLIVTGCVVTEVKQYGDVLCLEFEGGRKTTHGQISMETVCSLSITRDTGTSDKDWQRQVASARAVLHKKAAIAIRNIDLMFIRGGCLIVLPPAKVEIRPLKTP